jgi:glutamate/tyrosine decarboxylase-like PLP-dependent enzyme
VTDPVHARQEVEAALAVAAEEARAYVSRLDASPVLDAGTEDRVAEWSDPMPERGEGTMAALTELARRGRESATGSSGPRFFHFVIGGGTPAALAADWLTSAYDQVGYGWASSPFAARLEQVATDWLRQLFELPPDFTGVLTSGATMANFTGLTAARSWWGEQHGVDVDEHGLTGLPPVPVFSSGYLHPSARQAVGMLGMGQGRIELVAGDEVGRLDLAELDSRLAAAGPAILIANAGEVNAGDFDPIAAMADLAEAHGAWLHVDGAFGLFGRLAPESRPLTEGVERAHSVISDGHKWLNVPYDCGFAFVREPQRLARALNVGAPYLPSPDDPRPNPGFLSPENSRRARSLAVWATLRAYGRDGHREMVERHLALARHLARLVDEAPELERLADVRLNIVCFRAAPPGADPQSLDQLNRELGEALLSDGRVFAGTTVYGGRVALRPAIVNWRTTESDVELLVEVVRELVAARA